MSHMYVVTHTVLYVLYACSYSYCTVCPICTYVYIWCTSTIYHYYNSTTRSYRLVLLWYSGALWRAPLYKGHSTSVNSAERSVPMVTPTHTVCGLSAESQYTVQCWCVLGSCSQGSWLMCTIVLQLGGCITEWPLETGSNTGIVGYCFAVVPLSIPSHLSKGWDTSLPVTAGNLWHNEADGGWSGGHSTWGEGERGRGGC